MSSNLLKIDPKTITVGILGYTGETGKALTKEILSRDLFKKTVLIGRRKVDYQEDFYNRAEQTVIDFDKLEEHEDAFKNLDVVYCCLGTTRAKSGVEGFRKIDFDYVNNTAVLAAKHGCKQFHLVSSSGADKDSSFLYPQVKGQSEEAVKNLNFENSFMYRPKLLIGTNREEARFLERVFIGLTKPIQVVSPTLMSTPIDVLAKSMIANTILNTDLKEKSQIVINDKIFEAAKLYDEFIKTKQ
ncbi:unnamed protein product [Brachionus calyciflorus]|uniref:Protein HTATIP2 n=1 Tax=Brachionus calyciflorus TaxID=104777 RepID=A0A813WUT4_9BILA|nr:unnamed protein product [Brachionus calyciflorus]